MKRVFTLVVLVNAIGFAHSSDLLDEKIRLIATQNLPATPSELILFCDGPENIEWCKGYYTAISISLLEQGNKICLPVGENNRYLFDGAWTLTKAWLYKQEKNAKFTFYQSIKESLLNEAKCSS